METLTYAVPNGERQSVIICFEHRPDNITADGIHNEYNTSMSFQSTPLIHVAADIKVMRWYLQSTFSYTPIMSLVLHKWMDDSTGLTGQ